MIPKLASREAAQVEKDQLYSRQLYRADRLMNMHRRSMDLAAEVP